MTLPSLIGGASRGEVPSGPPTYRPHLRAVNQKLSRLPDRVGNSMLAPLDKVPLQMGDPKGVTVATIHLTESRTE